MNKNFTKKRIYFFNETTEAIPIKKKKLRQFILNIFEKKDIKVYYINFIFVSTEDIKRINKNYLKHNYSTDVITFPINNRKENLEAEVYISQEVVKSNALDFGATLGRELHRVIFHACLHLMGYDDQTKDEKKEMSSQENILLHEYEKE